MDLRLDSDDFGRFAMMAMAGVICVFFLCFFCGARKREQRVPVAPNDGEIDHGEGFGPPDRSVYEIGRAIQLVAIWPRVCDIRGGGGAFGGAGGDAMGCVLVKQSSRTRIFENDELNSTTR